MLHGHDTTVSRVLAVAKLPSISCVVANAVKHEFRDVLLNCLYVLARTAERALPPVGARKLLLIVNVN